MIFVTTGTQAPFDRLIQAVDESIPFLNGEEVVAQTCQSSYVPNHMTTVDLMSPADFFEHFNNAKLIIAHAGMGTVLSAMSAAKPLIVMPRLASLREHRNDHQLATVKKLAHMNFGRVVNDSKEMKEAIVAMLNGNNHTNFKPISNFASDELLKSLSNYIVSPDNSENL